jgi:hypothetical protein
VELDGLTLVGPPVLGGAVHRLPHRVERGGVGRFQRADRPDLTALGRTDVCGAAHPAHQVGADLLAEECGIVVIGDFVAHDRDPHPEVMA